MANNNSVRPNRPQIGNVSVSSRNSSISAVRASPGRANEQNLNQNMSRSGFVKTLGVSAAALGMAATGLGGVARANYPDPNIVGNPGDAVITVYPMNIYPHDVQNVQWAVDNVASPGTVILKSTLNDGVTPTAFNFGTNGIIKLLRPSITLTGDGWDTVLNEPKTKINGGGGPYLFSNVFVNPPITVGTTSTSAAIFAVNAPGVTIRELKMYSRTAASGIYISSAFWPVSDQAVVVEKNHIDVTNYCIFSMYTAAFPIRIDDNVLKSYSPIYAQHAGATLQSLPVIPPNTNPPFPYDEMVAPKDSNGIIQYGGYDITNNRIYANPPATGQWMGVRVFGWHTNFCNNPNVGCRRLRPSSSSLWTYQYVPGDNGPVRMIGNYVEFNAYPYTFEWAMSPGASMAGTNHALIANNIIKGSGNAGICGNVYSKDVQIINNDLSEFTAESWQITAGASNNTIANNLLGPVTGDNLNIAPVAGVWLLSTNWHPYPPALNASLNTPDPDPIENCTIMNNDYTRTGLPGWSDTTNGCILVTSNDANNENPPHNMGNEVRYNFIFETGLFPDDTGGPKQQVYVMDSPKIHDNRIVGLPAHGLTKPGIGQRMKGSLRLIAQKMAEAEELMEQS